ncbi:MAG: SprT family zinc-dependent metalloprotease, partial [Nitrososphaeraceae archaeon]
GRIAGKAQYLTFSIKINPAYLLQHTEEYINQTIPHEVAHLGVYQVYHINKGMKVDAHGPEWKNMMIRIGARPDRCHSMVIEGYHGKPKPKHAYKCGCGAIITVGPKVHSNIQHTMQVYRHNKCGGPLLSNNYIANMGQVSHSKATEMAYNNELPVPPPPVSTPSSKSKQPDPNSKIGKCYAYFKNNYNPKTTRQQWIAAFVQLGCTTAGASTYVNTCQKLKREGV